MGSVVRPKCSELWGITPILGRLEPFPPGPWLEICRGGAAGAWPGGHLPIHPAIGQSTRPKLRLPDLEPGGRRRGLGNHVVDQAVLEVLGRGEMKGVGGRAVCFVVGDFPQDGAPSGEITEYQLYSSMATRSATAIPKAPPEPPSPMTHETMGVSRRLISRRLKAMASACPRSSAFMPG